MPDMLVKLYEVAKGDLRDERAKAAGITVRRAIAPEMTRVVSWVRDTFGQGWADECTAAFANKPVSCYIAAKEQELLGFACYDATMKNFFGPTGVAQAERGHGIGTAMMLGCMHDMYAQGYGYCIIGGAGPVAYYQKMVGAIVIEGSAPGIYKDMLRAQT